MWQQTRRDWSDSARVGTQDHDARVAAIKVLLEAMLEGLAIGTEALELAILDTVAQRSRSFLRGPWAIDGKEAIRERTTLFLKAPSKRFTDCVKNG